MLDLNLFYKVLEILKTAIVSKISLEESLFTYGYNQEWWIDIQSKIDAAYIKGRIEENDFTTYKSLMDRLQPNILKEKDKTNSSDNKKIEMFVNEILHLTQFTKHDPEKKYQYKIQN